MKEIVELWEEYEEWNARRLAEKNKPMTVEISYPNFAQFIAWYRDVYPLKSPLDT